MITTQQQADALIEKIMYAQEDRSVTNVMVARVLDWLNVRAQEIVDDIAQGKLEHRQDLESMQRQLDNLSEALKGVNTLAGSAYSFASDNSRSIAKLTAWINAIIEFLKTGNAPSGWDDGNIEVLPGIETPSMSLLVTPSQIMRSIKGAFGYQSPDVNTDIEISIGGYDFHSHEDLIAAGITLKESRNDNLIDITEYIGEDGVWRRRIDSSVKKLCYFLYESGNDSGDPMLRATVDVPIAEIKLPAYSVTKEMDDHTAVYGDVLLDFTLHEAKEGIYTVRVSGLINDNSVYSRFSGVLGYAPLVHSHEEYESRFEEHESRFEELELSYGYTEGGDVLAHRFGNDFETATKAALAYAKANGFSTVDASWFSGEHICQTRFIIDFPVTLKLGNIVAKMQDSMFFNIKANNVCIIGCNRQTDKTIFDGNATELVLEGISTQCNDGYHIYSRGHKNCQYRNMVLRGIQTSTGRQCNNPQYPINGTGGIFIEKPNPGTVTFGNTTNATIIENLLIDGTKAHGIYLDTPILSMLRDVRVSSAGGHGVFISGGTTVTLESVYVASARYAGFCLQGVTYCSVINSVAENCGCGWWLRSVNNVSLFSPGVETTYNLGLNPWSNSQPISKRYGVAEDTLSSDGQLVRIVDVPDEEWQMGNRTIHARSLFCGYAFVVTGGRNIAIHTPYSISIANEVDPENPRLDRVKDQLCTMLILGNCRALHINNALFQEQAGSPIPDAIRHEIEIAESATGVDLSFNPYGTILSSYTSLTPVTSDQSKTAPVLCLSKTSMVHCGNIFYTDIVYTGNVEIIGTAKIGGQIITDSGIITKGPIVEYDSATLKVTCSVNTELRELDFAYDGTEIKIVPKATFALENVTDDTEFSLYVDGVVRKTQTGNAEMSFKLTSPGEHTVVVAASWDDKSSESEPIVFTVKEPDNLPIRFVSTEVIAVEDTFVTLRISYQGTYVVKEAGIAYSSNNQSPTTSQNSRKLDTVDDIVAEEDGLTYYYDIDLPRSNASTLRYVRGYVRATEDADSTSAYAIYDTQVYKVLGDDMIAI